jgi:hypothetical protein
MKRKSRSFKMTSAIALSASALGLLAWITPANYYQLIQENDLIRSLKKKL